MISLGLHDASPRKRVRKRMPAGAVVNLAGTDRLRGLAATVAGPTSAPILSGLPATGQPPDPGPVPLAQQTDRVPLRYQYPLATNQTWTPRAGLTPFAQLRALADLCPEIRICIETRKDGLGSLDWNIAPRDKASQGHEGEIVAARAFFEKPDKRRAFATWLRMAVEDVLVIDALSVYRRRTRGGDLYALELKDGASFKPLLDDTGDTPIPPAVAYRQIIYGQPVKGGDCTADDLIYRPRTARTHTPYGLSPTEAILLAVNAALSRQMFNLEYYAEGNLPEGFMDAPGQWSADQLETFQTWWDAMLAGDLAKRRRLKFVSQGMAKTYTPSREPNLTGAPDEWFLKLVAASFAVPPSELGFTNEVNKATAGQQENVMYRRGVKPLARYFKELFDEILAVDFGLGHLEWTWLGGEAEDQKMKAEVDNIYVRLGKVGVDELRARDGQPLIGMGPAVFLPTGPVFVEELVNGVDEDPTTTDPAASETPKDTTPPDEPLPGDGDPPALTAAAQADLRKWKTVAIKAAKKGQTVKAFTSGAIPRDLHAALTTDLAEAHTVAAVVHVFEHAEKRQILTAEQRIMREKLRRLAADHFKAQGEALAAHLQAGLEAEAAQEPEAAHVA